MRDVSRSQARLAQLVSPVILLALTACGGERAPSQAAAAQPAPLWPLAIYASAALIVAAAMIGISAVLGQRHSDRETSEPYESGISSTGTARLRFSAHFYLIAMLFVIFDIEAVFLFAWAVAYRDVGWAGYAGALVFIAVLSIALLYEWRLGALDWGRSKVKGKS